MDFTNRALMGFLLSLFITSGTAAAATFEVKTGGDCLNMRERASFRSPVLRCLPPGTKLQVRDDGQKYVYADNGQGLKGYVWRGYLKPAGEPAAEQQTEPATQEKAGQLSGSARQLLAGLPSGGLTRRDCRNNISNTVYFLPVQGDNSRLGLKKNTNSFHANVKLQGSGVLANGNRLSYLGKITPPPENCTTTRTSASRQCLLSYFSIAADVKKRFRLGDIVYVPSMKGKRIRLPDSGRVIEHPGLFIVHDVGGAIKGTHRMDFFTGKDNPLVSSNQFNKLGFGNKHSCNRPYQHIKKSDRRYQAAYELIYSLTDSTRTRYNNPQRNAPAAPAVASR